MSSGDQMTAGTSDGDRQAGTSGSGFDTNNPGSFMPSAGGDDNADQFNWESDSKASLCSARESSPPWMLLGLWGLLGLVAIRRHKSELHT